MCQNMNVRKKWIYEPYTFAFDQCKSLISSSRYLMWMSCRTEVRMKVTLKKMVKPNLKWSPSVDHGMNLDWLWAKWMKQLQIFKKIENIITKINQLILNWIIKCTKTYSLLSKRWIVYIHSILVARLNHKQSIGNSKHRLYKQSNWQFWMHSCQMLLHRIFSNPMRQDLSFWKIRNFQAEILNIFEQNLFFFHFKWIYTIMKDMLILK